MFEPIFSSFISQNNLKCNLDHIKKYIFNIQKKDKKGRKVSNQGGWQSKPLATPNESINELFFQINSLVLEIKKNVSISKDLKLQTYWCNINSENDYNRPHVHLGATCMISGVFFVDVNKNSGNLICLNNSQTDGFIYDNKVSQYNLYNSSIWTVKPKNNLCVLFPSNLTHFVEPNRSNQKRISMSFNYGF